MSRNISFTASIINIKSVKIVRLPKNVSERLSSRGLVMVKLTINGYSFLTTLEPDGYGSHWFRLDQDVFSSFKPGDTVEIILEPSNDWTEVEVPVDLKLALSTDSKAEAMFNKITPMARWEWVRWIRATNKEETRARRIGVALSKLKAGSRRPCCFNSSACTDFSVSRNGKLAEPTGTIINKA